MKPLFKKAIASIAIIAGLLVGGVAAAAPANAATLGRICVSGSSEAGVSYRNYGTTQAWSYVGVGSCVYINSTKQVSHGQGYMTNVTNGVKYGPGASAVVGPPVTWIFYVDR